LTTTKSKAVMIKRPGAASEPDEGDAIEEDPARAVATTLPARALLELLPPE
jgi:hypothetical protein